MTRSIDFWFSIGSTYSYLTVMRLNDVQASGGVTFTWCPFNVRDIMVEQNNRPFVGKPVKSAYMWRDIERRAAMYGLPVRVPAPYPLPELEFANRVAILAAEEGWCAEYAIATYQRWFQLGQEPGTEPNLSDSLREVGQDPQRVIAEARAGRIGNALRAATDRARAAGVFGSPTFVVGTELFWGDDRLDDALAWSRNGSLRNTTN
ncbi:MAG TPA: DsbA family protein [Acetobacteraceae bacterium]|nr:DsbA family protein [Acetobacteraceae bacterium]